MDNEKEFVLGKALITSRQIRRRITEIAGGINRTYAGKSLYILVLLKGSFIFAADLLRALRVNSYIDFVKVESYGASSRPKGFDWHFTLNDDIRGKDLLIVDDIYDSGATLANVLKYIRALRPGSVRTCVLLRKKLRHPRVGRTKLDYVGFDVPDVFVVGYGLDFVGRYRNLPYIAAMVKA